MIKLKKDIYLLKAIKFNFQITTSYNKHCILAKKENLNEIVNHCFNYPLLGEKSKLFFKLFKYQKFTFISFKP